MREVSDLAVSAGVRRELAGRRIDLSKIKFPVAAGVVTLQGELAFVGLEKTNEEVAIELKFLEASLKGLMGVKSVAFELTNWKKNETGIWESEAAKSSNGKAKIEGEGIVCPECDFVIRFCPCCGKPLGDAKCGTANAINSALKAKRPPLPIKPIIKKKRPLPVVGQPATVTPAIQTQAPKPALMPNAFKSVVTDATDKTSTVAVQKPISETKPNVAPAITSKPVTEPEKKPSDVVKPVVKPVVAPPKAVVADNVKPVPNVKPVVSNPVIAPVKPVEQKIAPVNQSLNNSIPNVSVPETTRPEAENNLQKPIAPSVAPVVSSPDVPQADNSLDSFDPFAALDIEDNTANQITGQQQTQQKQSEQIDSNPFASLSFPDEKPSAQAEQPALSAETQAFDPFSSLNDDILSIGQESSTGAGNIGFDPFAPLNEENATQPQENAFDPFAPLNEEKATQPQENAFDPFAMNDLTPSGDTMQNTNPFGSNPFGADPFAASNDNKQQQDEAKASNDPFAGFALGDLGNMGGANDTQQVAGNGNNASDPFANLGNGGDFSFPSFDMSEQSASKPADNSKQNDNLNVPDFNFNDIFGSSSQNADAGSGLSGLPSDDGNGMPVFDLGEGMDDDTPLPPMKSQAPANKTPKASKANSKPQKGPTDMFASLFQTGGNGDSGAFGNIDFDLDVEVVPTGDNGGGSGSGSGGAASQSPDSFDLGVFDLDAPVAPSGSGGKKGKSDLNLDDFDLSKFNI